MSLSRYLHNIGFSILLGALTIVQAANPPEHPPSQEADWPVYGGQRAGNRYSTLRQINRSNVKQLKLAWTFDTGEKGELQTNPLVIGGTVFACSPLAKDHCAGRFNRQAVMDFQRRQAGPSTHTRSELLDRWL